MKWLISIETEDDIIIACRLMNIFRRKGVTLLTFSMTKARAGFCIMAVVECPESDWEHQYHFIRRTEGVRHVDAYRHQPAGPAQYMFIELAEAASHNGHMVEAPPGTRTLFACQGKLLVEALPGVDLSAGSITGALFFSNARSTREAIPTEQRSS